MILEPPVLAPRRTPTLDVQVLLVEDEKITRVRLSKLLEKRGIKTVQAAFVDEAYDLVGNARASVVLMDIQMGRGVDDGIDISQKILMTHPQSSIIFVSAYAEEPDYRQRAEAAKLRVAAWLTKPIWDRLDQVVELIGKEVQKVELRLSFERAIDKGTPLSQRLHEFLIGHPSYSPMVIGDIVEELTTNKRIDTECGIQLIYVALEHFAGRFEHDPTSRALVNPLLSILEILEEREADEFEEAFVSRFRVRPGEICDLYDWGRSLLKE